MPAYMEPIENPLTHRHGFFGCYLQPGVDPTAKPIALPPGFFGGSAPSVAVAPSIGSVTPMMPATGMPLMPSLLGYLAVAVAYFALGVAVGALVSRLRRLQTPILFILVVPGLLAGFWFLAWVVYTLV